MVMMLHGKLRLLFVGSGSEFPLQSVEYVTWDGDKMYSAVEHSWQGKDAGFVY